MILPKRIWKDIPNYEGMYQVSNLGEVKSLNYNHTKCAKLLKISIDNYGYGTVTIDGKRVKVHRLVAQTFIPNPYNLPQVNHKNENKTDNRVSNLEWCDAKYNCNYGTRNLRMGNSLSGSGNGMYGKKHSSETKVKIGEKSKKKVICIETGMIFDSLKDLANYLDVNYNSVIRVLNGYRKSLKGLHFKYYKED